MDTFIIVNSAVKLVQLVTLRTSGNSANATDKKGQFICVQRNMSLHKV